MGCAYSSSNHNNSKKKSNTSNKNDNNTQTRNNVDSSRLDANSSSNRRRIFDATYISMNGQKQSGQIEITDNELIFHYGNNKHLDWPLKYLRGYGSSNTLFSFECGRKCSTGQGTHVFECLRANQLIDTLVQQIGVMSNNINHNHHNNNNNVNLSNSQSHLQINNNNDTVSMSFNNNVGPSSTIHEYQNLSNDMIVHHRPGSNLEHNNNNNNNNNNQIPVTTARSSSSQGVHTYLNSSVINGQMKSQPNYYSTNPILQQDSSGSGTSTSVSGTKFMNESKYSLNEMINNTNNRNYRWSSGHHHTADVFINNNNHQQQFKNNRTRRSSDSNHEHLYLNHYLNNHLNLSSYNNNNNNNMNMNIINAKKLEQIHSKMDESDNLGTFCYVNFEQNKHNNNNNNNNNKSRKSAINGLKNRFNHDHNHNNNNNNNNNNNSRVVTPESYVQLELNNRIDNELNNDCDLINNDDVVNNSPMIDHRKCSLSSINNNNNNNNNAPPTAKMTKINNKFSYVILNNNNNNNNNDSHVNINNVEQIRRNSIKTTNGERNLQTTTTQTQTQGTVPYAQIDFAKTLALQASTANHRKL